MKTAAVFLRKSSRQYWQQKIELAFESLTSALPSRHVRTPSNEPAHRSMRLEAGEVITLTDSSAVKTVAVRSGAVWLTETPGKEDVVLEAGDKRLLRENWPIVIQALTDTDLSLQ